MSAIAVITRKFSDWILYTSLFAAACTVSLCLATERLILQQFPSVFNALHGFVAGATLMVYNVHHLARERTAAADLTHWVLRLSNWNTACFVLGGALCGITVAWLPKDILLICPLLGLLSFAYSLPLLPFVRRHRLREFGWIKILLLTSVWTIVTAILPMLYYGHDPAKYPYEILLRFVFMLVLCIAFDIRDMQTDLQARIYTLPNRIGLTASYRLMDGLLILFAILSVIQYLRYPVPGRLRGEIATAICTKAAIAYTRRHPSDKAYLAYIDGMMLLYGLLLLLH